MAPNRVRFEIRVKKPIPRSKVIQAVKNLERTGLKGVEIPDSGKLFMPEAVETFFKKAIPPDRRLLLIYEINELVGEKVVTLKIKE